MNIRSTKCIQKIYTKKNAIKVPSREHRFISKIWSMPPLLNYLNTRHKPMLKVRVVSRMGLKD